MKSFSEERNTIVSFCPSEFVECEFLFLLSKNWKKRNEKKKWKKEMKKRNEMKWNDDQYEILDGVMANTRAFAEEKIISTHATYYLNPAKSPQHLATLFFEEKHFILHLDDIGVKIYNMETHQIKANRSNLLK